MKFYVGQKVRILKEASISEKGKRTVIAVKDSLYVIHKAWSWTCRCPNAVPRDLYEVGILTNGKAHCAKCETVATQGVLTLMNDEIEAVEVKGNRAYMAQVDLLHLLAGGRITGEEYKRILLLTQSPDVELLDLAETFIKKKPL